MFSVMMMVDSDMRIVLIDIGRMNLIGVSMFVVSGIEIRL